MNTNEDKFFVKIHLVVVAVEKNAGQNFSSFLMNSNTYDFPAKLLAKGESAKDIAEELMRDHTGVPKSWSFLYPIGLVDNQNESNEEVAIVYSLFIPQPTRIRIDETQWVGYSEIIKSNRYSDFTKKIINEVIWRKI